MITSFISGFPRIGPGRELKLATEALWAGKGSEAQLQEVAAKIRKDNWQFAKDAGAGMISSGDFSLYDHILDMVCQSGVVPERYGHEGGEVSLDTYFAMARGRQSVVAMEMTKWFNTNYHYLVPEFSGATRFQRSGSKPVDEYREAKKLGIESTPVLIGPFSYLMLGKGEIVDPLALIESLLPIYESLLADLAREGAEWIQLDEPVLVQDQSAEKLKVFHDAYTRLSLVNPRPKILVKTYFGEVAESFGALRDLPIEGIGLDFVAGPQNEEHLVAQGGIGDKILFAGVVDGHNIWRTDLRRTLDLLKRLQDTCPALVVTNSCSLQHVPITLAHETKLDQEVRGWLAFAKEKVHEIVTLAKALREGVESVGAALAENDSALKSRRESTHIHNVDVRKRMANLRPQDERRKSPYATRSALQADALNLPLFPATTIGSYPQTKEIRRERARLRRGEITPEEYELETKAEIERVIRFQEKTGLDVLVHGEPERNDMVQYFGELLDGYAFTENAWVQSYGTRYVRPPIVYGDIARKEPMTIEWIKYAQSLTDKPVKGMLTGPVTMLMWSFVRDDQPLADTCTQLALAIRDEVADLEAAGVRVIQVDEAALREGLPLRKRDWAAYLEWAVRCFRLASSPVSDETQIHMHMCYSDFGDIIEAIHALDADVSLIEASRSDMELLDDFKVSGFDRGIGPGVYDIHSPRVPPVDEMVEKLRLAAKTIDPNRIWVTPDCGLKTRGWEETETSLIHMVEAARTLRAEFAR